MKKVIKLVCRILSIATKDAVVEEAKIVSLIERKGRKTVRPGSLRAVG